MFGQNTVVLALVLHLLIPRCPKCRHCKYPCCKDCGMTILVPFIMMPFAMCMLNQCIQNACRSASKSPWFSRQPFCMTLANSPIVDPLKFDDKYPAVSHLGTSSVLLHVDLESHRLLLFSDTMQQRQSAIITLVCLTYLTVYLYWFKLRNKCCNQGLNSARGLMLNRTNA